MKIVVALLVALVVFSVNGVAQEYVQWGLPEGAKLRIGRGMMRDLAYSPDGSRLAIASAIGIWLYDAATLEEVALISYHVATASSFDIWLNDAETLEEGALIRQHAGEMLSVAYSPDGSLLAGGSENGRMRLWDATTGVPKHLPILIGSDVVSVEFSRDGMALASAGGNQAQIGMRRRLKNGIHSSGMPTKSLVWHSARTEMSLRLALRIGLWACGMPRRGSSCGRLMRTHNRSLV